MKEISFVWMLLVPGQLKKKKEKNDHNELNGHNTENLNPSKVDLIQTIKKEILTRGKKNKKLLLNVNL